MKNKFSFCKNRAILVLMLLAVLSLGVVFVNPFLQNNVVFAEEVIVNLSNKYSFGETITIPVGNIKYDGKEIASQRTVVIFPDGSATGAKEITFDQSGEYTVKYIADDKDVTVIAERKIKVDDELCSFEDSNSGFYYGTNSNYNVTGLNISAKVDDSVKINKIIDLKDFSYGDGPFIEFMWTPEKLGVADAYTTYLTLTDAYDESNFVTIRMQNWSDWGSWADGVCYIDVRANNQEWTSSVTLDYNYHKRGETGKGWYMADVSMTGGRESVPVYETIKISYDDLNKALVTSDNSYSAENLVELNNPKWYDLEKESLWEGFTTGECYVSFSGERFNASSLNLCVTNLVGVDLQETTAVDNAAPSIEVDYAGEDSGNLPYAIVGQPYSVYKATAIDAVDGATDVIANVYYDYNGKKSIVDVADGCFTPSKEGTYTILYYSKDKMGNAARKTVDVACIAAPASELAVEIQNPASAGVTGESIKLFDGVDIVDGNGLTSYRVAVIDESGNETEIGSDFKFTPLTSGTYKVEVTGRDYVSAKEESFDLVVEDNPNPVFLTDAKLPKFFIKGATYSIETLTAQLLTNKTSQDIAGDIYISENGGAETLCKGEYTPSAAGTVEIIFKAANGENIGRKKYEAKVVDVGYGVKDGLLLGNYFYNEDGKASLASDNDGMNFSAAEDTYITFVNRLQAREFNLEFNIDKNKQNFEKLNFYLIDSENVNIAVKVSYMIGDGNTLLNLNDSWFNKTVPVDTNSAKIDRLMLNYSETTNRIKVHQSTDWGVSTDMHGNPFNGFPSREVYVVCELEGVTGDAGVKIYSLNGQSLSASDTDDFRPRIYTNGTIGECLLGDVVTLYPASYYDVLDPNLDATCAVYGPDGNPVVASDGTVLDENCSTDREYTFTVTEYGVYSVEYVCRDSSRNKQEYSYVFEVVDNIAPTVTFVSPKTSASVGSTVTVAKTEITDNLDSAENITVKYFVKAPQSFIITEIDASGTFKAESRGVYTVYCYAFDSMRNTTIVSYDIEVK